MRNFIKIVLAIVIVFPILFNPNVDAKAESEPIVTVELRNYIGNKDSLQINMNGQYLTGNDANDELLKELTSFILKIENGALVVYDHSKKVGIVEGNLFLNPTNIATDSVQIVGDNGTRRYRGSFEFKIETIETKEYIRPYNKVLLEEYVKGVVPREALASWHSEALKSQAIAARTYVTRKSFKVNDTQGNQVYGGIEETSYQKKISDVVEATRGEVLKIGSSYADAVFSSSNGGHTETNQGAWGYPALSYLPAKADSFDPLHRWDFSLKEDQISLQGYNLAKPEAWWNNVQEADAIVRNNMKPWLKTELKLPSTSDIKILSIEELTIHPERTAGKRIKSGTAKISFIEKSNTGFSKDANGNIDIKIYQNAKLTGDQIRALFGTMNMKSLLVDTIESPTSTDITRISGTDRIATSVEIAKQLYPNGFPANHAHKTVFIATSNDFADALSAGPLAYQYGNAPILLTGATSLSNNVATEIKRLKATKVFILGGKVAVSDQVMNQIKNISTVDSNQVIRISGPSRYETNAEINKRLTSVEGLFVASGENFADALAGSSVAAINKYAVVLTKQNALPNGSQTFISKHISKPVYLLGGTIAIADNVLQQVKQVKANAERLSGADRYATLAMILHKFKASFNGTEVIYSTGSDFPDALTSSSLAAAKKAPLILVGGDLSKAIEPFLTGYRDNLEQINVLGGTVAVSEDKVNQLKDKLDVITILRLSGTGFGHGVGMSQYGAQARALKGHSYTQILAFYYPGTGIDHLY